MNPGCWLRTAWPALCLLACTGWAQAAVQLEPVDGSLTPAQTEATHQLLADAVQRLPTAWADALNQPIQVEWRDDLPAQVHGRAKSRLLLLDRALLDGWMARPQDAGLEDPATRAVLSAVIHELAHFYDRTPQGQLSRDPRLLDLAGWQVSPMRLGSRMSRNDFRDRSPDRYELESPVEFVAVNLEYFLLDPAYACRRPDLYGHFAAHFGSQPTPAECAQDFVVLQAVADASESPLLQLDPERVYAVEYLLAEGNERPMSRWGHSMLRLVVCAPGRARGPDCRLDLQYHLVLSFRAFVGDVQISSWRGLTGSYPSRLFVLPLAQVIEEYTRVELRGLQSIPLQLEPAEIADLLERTARLHWSYDGHYYFLSNNCAVETFKLLHDGVRRLAGEDLSSITPTGLLRRLKQAGIADSTVLDDRDEAMRLGYYFEALNARYQAMFEVARQALQLPQAKVQDWLDLTGRRTRALAPARRPARERRTAAARTGRPAPPGIAGARRIEATIPGPQCGGERGPRGGACRRAGCPAPGGLPQPPGGAAARHRLRPTSGRGARDADRGNQPAGRAVAAAERMAAQRSPPMDAAGTAGRAGCDRGQCRFAGRAATSIAPGTRRLAAALRP